MGHLQTQPETRGAQRPFPAAPCGTLAGRRVPPSKLPTQRTPGAAPRGGTLTPTLHLRSLGSGGGRVAPSRPADEWPAGLEPPSRALTGACPGQVQARQDGGQAPALCFSPARHRDPWTLSLTQGQAGALQGRGK